MTEGKTVKTVGILRRARTTQLKLGVNERGLGRLMYRNFFAGVLDCWRRGIRDGSGFNTAQTGANRLH